MVARAPLVCVHPFYQPVQGPSHRLVPALPLGEPLAHLSESLVPLPIRRRPSCHRCRTGPGDLPLERTFPFRASASGVAHAALCSWEVWTDDEADAAVRMTTHPEDTVSNFPRDMQWGQGLQLLEELEASTGLPVPFAVRAGEELELVVRFSHDMCVLQSELRRRGAPADPAPDA